jgi:hypothetical protein
MFLVEYMGWLLSESFFAFRPFGRGRDMRNIIRGFCGVVFAGSVLCQGAAAFAGNTVPTLTLGGNQSAAEGAVVTITGTFSDPDAGQTHTASVNWGDVTSGPAGVNEAGHSLIATHVYDDNGSYLVTVTLMDSAGGQDTKQVTATISNVAPVVEAGPDRVIYSCQSLGLTGVTFHDAGTADTHNATVNWGDGSPVGNASVSESPYGPPGSTAGMDGSVSASHTYATIGTFNVTVEVSDNDGALNADSFVVQVSTPGGCRLHSGDLNCDGVTNSSDVPTVVGVLLNGGTAAQVGIVDLNGDHVADGGDIDPLVDCLMGGPCGVGLSDGLLLDEHRIFVTSTAHNGNLGGIAGADAMCQACAQNAGLQRTYRAIISAPGDNAVDRLVISGSIWLLTCAGFEKVADDATDLWDGSIDRSVAYDEFGVFVDANVHTGCQSTGILGSSHCSSWTLTTGNGVFGRSTLTVSAWISNSGSNCALAKHVYCISQ